MANTISKSRKYGQRRCRVDGSSAPKDGLIRFVLSPEGVVTADILEKLPGRGVWVGADPQKINEAVRKNVFASGFKEKVEIPENLTDNVEQALTKRVLSLLSVARKAGQAISGADRVEEALGEGKVKLLLQAKDGSQREKRNLSYRSEADNYFEMLNREELGMVFSRENVVHAALTGKEIANRVLFEADRLKAFRDGTGGKI